MNNEENGTPYNLYSVQLNNRVGQLNDFLPILKDWNIIGLRIVNTGNTGLVQFILPFDVDENDVINTLKNKGYWVTTLTYYGVFLDNTTKLLDTVITPLTKVGANITDTFVTTPLNGLTRMFVTFDNIEKGLPVLRTIPVPTTDKEPVAA